MAFMMIAYSVSTNAWYIGFQPGDIKCSAPLDGTPLVVDVDEGGHPVGLEFLDATRFLSFLMEHGGRLEIPEQIDPGTWGSEALFANAPAG